MFKNLFKKAIIKIVKYFYYSSLKKVIAEDVPIHDKSIIFGENCYITPSAILISVENGSIEFEGNNYVGRNVEIGAHNSKIWLGLNTSIQDRCILLGDIYIGRYCVFAPNVYISSGKHYYNHKPELYIKDQDELVLSNLELSKQHSKKVIIEDDCWLGMNVVVMSGIKIAKGSVIGANSVVTKDVEPYSVMAGSPAKLIKRRINFELKESINYINDFDLPYFYNGFNTNLKTLTENRIEGGISVRQDFTAYLLSENKKNITLKIKTTNPVKIEYFNQIKEVQVGDYFEVSFNVANTKLHSFKILNEVMKNKVFIQSIRTI